MFERLKSVPWLLLLVLVAAPLFPLWRCVAHKEAIGAFNQVRQFAPWNLPTDGKPWDVLQADSVLQFFPWRQLVFESWSRGHVPFWNPYEFAGAPLLANSQSGALYPLHILVGLAGWPTHDGMLLLAWFHLAWAGIGVFYLSKQFGVRNTGAVVAGLIFSLSPFMLAWTSLASVITTVCWIPWILTFILQSSRLEKKNQRVKAACYGALCVGMMILAGHLQFAAYGLLAAVLTIVVETFAPKDQPASKRGPGASKEAASNPEPGPKLRADFPFLGRAFLILLAGAMLAAPQLLPVLSFSKFSHRRGEATSDGYQRYVGAAIKPYSLGNLAFGTLTGDPAKFPEGVKVDAPVSSYWPVLDPPFLPYAESAVALGPLAFALVFLAPWRHRRRGMVHMAVIGVVGLLLALGTPLNYLLYYLVPGWSATGSPGRVIVLFVLASSVLAGLAIDRLSSSRKHDSSKMLMPCLLPIILVVICYLGTKVLGPSGDLGTVAEAATRSALPWAVGAAVASALAMYASFKLHKPGLRWYLVAAPILICMMQGGTDLIRTGNVNSIHDDGIQPADPYARVAVINQAWSMPVAAHALAPANVLSSLHIHELSGYDSLIHRDTVEMLRDVDGQDPATEANGNMMFVKPTADPIQLAEAGVSEVWSLKDLPQFGTPFATNNGFNRYHLEGPGRASTPAGPAKIEKENQSAIRVHATGPGRLVLRDRNMPGWSAQIENVPTELKGTRWLEVDLPAGEQTVIFKYSAPGYSLGLWLFLIPLVAILVLLAPRIEVSSAGASSSTHSKNRIRRSNEPNRS